MAGLACSYWRNSSTSLFAIGYSSLPSPLARSCSKARNFAASLDFQRDSQPTLWGLHHAQECFFFFRFLRMVVFLCLAFCKPGLPRGWLTLFLGPLSSLLFSPLPPTISA